MMLLTKETDYAIRAAVRLAERKGEFVPSSEIAQEEGIPLQFLRRILRTLAKAKIVSSREGASGGTRLDVAPAKLTVLSLIELFQGRIQLSECLFRKNICCKRSACVLRRNIEVIEHDVAESFKKLTVKHLIDKKTISNRRKVS